MQLFVFPRNGWPWNIFWSNIRGGGGGGGRVTLKDDKEENEDFHEEGNMFYCLSQNRLENCK